MGLSIDGIMDNIKIIDVSVSTEKIYAEDEIRWIDIKFRYEYTFLDKLVGEIELSTTDMGEVKEIIAREISKEIDKRGMYV